MKPPTSHAQEALIFSTAEFAVLLPECLYFPCPLLISILSCYSNTLQPNTVISRHIDNGYPRRSTSGSHVTGRSISSYLESMTNASMKTLTQLPRDRAGALCGM